MANEGFDAGSIFVALKSNVENLRAGIVQAETLLKGFGRETTSLATKITAFGRQIGNAMLAPVRAVSSLVSSLFTLKGAIFALVLGKTFQALVTGPADAAVELQRMAARAGIATDALEKLQFVVSAAGGRGEDVSFGLEKLNKIIQDTKNGSDQFIPTLRELGLLGLDINQIVDKIFTNPNLGAAGLKKLGISELAVLARLSKEEVNQLLVSFIKLGNGTDASLFKLGNRFQVVKTQLAEAFGNITEQFSKVFLPPLLSFLESVEKFIEAHFPEILAFFDTIGEQVDILTPKLKEAFSTPEKSLDTLTKLGNVFGKFVADLLGNFFEVLVPAGIRAAIAVFDGIVSLVGPGFVAIAAQVIIELGALFEKVGVTILIWQKTQIEVAINVFRRIFAKGLEIFSDFIKSVADGIDATGGAIGKALGVTIATDKLRDAALDIHIASDDILFATDDFSTTIDNNVKLLETQKKLIDEQAKLLSTDVTETLDAAGEKIIEAQKGRIKDSAQTLKTEFLKSIDAVGESLNSLFKGLGNVFGVAFDAKKISAAFSANLLKQQADADAAKKKQEEKSKEPPKPDFTGIKTTTANEDAEAQKRQQELEKQLQASEQSINNVIGGLTDGLRGFMNDVFVEGKSTMEALGGVAAKLSDKFIGDTVEKLQGSLSKGLAAAFDNPAVGGAVADLAGALIGIAATVFSIFQSKSSSKKNFSPVTDLVTSSQAVRGVVAGPENVAIAAVGEDLQRALEPTNDILRAQLVALFDIRSAMKGGGGTGGGVPFAGAVSTT